MGSPYIGTYSMSFGASFENGGIPDMQKIRTERCGIDKTHTIIYRDSNNQAGLPPNYELVDEKILSPTKFEN